MTLFKFGPRVPSRKSEVEQVLDALARPTDGPGLKAYILEAAKRGEKQVCISRSDYAKLMAMPETLASTELSLLRRAIGPTLFGVEVIVSDLLP